MGGALKTVDSILGYVKDGQGKPSEGERALFAAAVVFIYGIWENFIEQLAIELVEGVGNGISPERVPEQIRKLLDKKSAWELTVTPGWRSLWIAHVKDKAIGDDDDTFGMNSAKAGQVRQLLSLAGVSDPFHSISSDDIPDHLPTGQRDPAEAINRLVELRGEIVHTGKVPGALRKAHVHSWRRFVERAADSIDSASRANCKDLLK